MNDARKLGWIGVAFGCGGIVAAAIFFVAIYSIIGFRRPASTPVTCEDNMHKYGNAISMYVMDYDDSLPPADHWFAGIGAYAPNLQAVRCPQTGSVGASGSGYAYNRAMASQRVAKAKDRATTVLVFDSTLPDWNGCDLIKSVPSPGRHQGGNNFLYLDYHVGRLTDEQSKALSASTPRNLP